MVSPLDPKDWQEFREAAHRLLDSCVDQLAGARDLPWKPVPADYAKAVRLDGEPLAGGVAALTGELQLSVLPHHSGNTHPRFWGWVQGTGLADSLLAEMVAATMNSNLGGRDHGAVYVEREVLRWCRGVFGFPETSSGVMVSGTSQATVIALACARLKALGPHSRRNGIQDGAKLIAYAAQGAHNAIAKAMELLGLGSAQLRLVPAVDGPMTVEFLRQKTAEDRTMGLQPFCVVATAGSVDRGCFDDLEKIAALCDMENLWMHVDGAFGAWLRLADAPWRGLTAGIEKADSIALDFHKFMFVPYDCGAVLIRDESIHRATFAARPDYLASGGEALAGGEPWFCDYGIELSRGFRALKVWTALRLHGEEAFGAAISNCCSHARYMAERVSQIPVLKLAAPVVSNVCCFSVNAGLPPEDLSRINQQIAARLQVSGEAVFSTTKIDGVTVLRAAIVNHRTSKADIDIAVTAAAREAARLLQDKG